MLSEQEKESDRKEVRTYLPMIMEVVESAEKIATEEAVRKCVGVVKSIKMPEMGDASYHLNRHGYSLAKEDIASSLEALIK